MTDSLEAALRRAIRTIPDYPKKGVMFKDLTTVWVDGRLSRRLTKALVDHCGGLKADKVVAIEARGFIVGAALADRLGVGLVPARKTGKLPGRTVSADYELEYGKQRLEIHSDSISKGERILIVDDLLATGGTAGAAKELVERLGGKVVGFVFITELTFLGGRKRLTGYGVHSLVKYDKSE